LEVIHGFEAAKARLSRRAAAEPDELSPAVSARLRAVFGRDVSAPQAVEQILKDVQARGDAAVLSYIQKIDGMKLDRLEIGRTQISEAYEHIGRTCYPP